MSGPSVEGQGDLFPRHSPESIALMLERVRRRCDRLGPQLTPEDCLRVLGEIALLERVVEKIETFKETLARFQRPLVTSKQCHWRSPTSPIPYSPATGDATSFISRGRSARRGTPPVTISASLRTSTAE